MLWPSPGDTSLDPNIVSNSSNNPNSDTNSNPKRDPDNNPNDWPSINALSSRLNIIRTLSPSEIIP
jgi:hypothetical protein